MQCPGEALGVRRPRLGGVDGEQLAAVLGEQQCLVADGERAERTPGIVMTGPVSSVKEQTLPHYAERFSDAGYTVLAFDPRGFGESEGEPRFHYDPWLIVSDYVNTSSYLMAREDVDAERVAAHIELYDQDPYVTEAVGHVLRWLRRVLP
jgi:fermentation-respiration switch protein FrsA (DUF1100 family)